jgi:hypothetical protein
MMILLVPPMFFGALWMMGTMIEGIADHGVELDQCHKRAESPYEYHQCQWRGIEEGRAMNDSKLASDNAALRMALIVMLAATENYPELADAREVAETALGDKPVNWNWGAVEWCLKYRGSG